MFDDENEDDPELDEAFPLGDPSLRSGQAPLADVEAVVHCPYCGEANEIALDPGGGSMQQYVEDCHVCCQPWNVFVTYADDGSAEVALTPADE